jgi:hypothetical protein
MLAEARWEGGKFHKLNEEQYARDFARMKLKDGTLVHLRITRPTRSERANAYYWSTVLNTIVEESESGNTAEDLHDAFCERFIVSQRKEVEFFNKTTGKTLITAVEHRRSSILDGMAFYDFVEEVREFARTFWGIETPDPDPTYWRKRERTT